MRRDRLTMLAVGSVLVAGLAGCGDDGVAPAAEPAPSPPLARPAAGTSFAVGSLPEALVIDPRSGLAAVITRDPSALTLADLDRRRVVERTPLEATGRHLALAAPGGPVLVPAEASDQLVAVRLPSGRASTINVEDHPHDVAVAAERFFVGNEFGDDISVVDGNRVVATLDAPQQPGGMAASGGYVAAVAVAERVLEVYDADTLEAVGVVPAGQGPTHVVAASGTAWVADTDGDAIRAFTLGPHPKPRSAISVAGAPYGIAIDPRRERLWVTLTATNQLVEYDVSGAHPAELRRYPTLRQPNSVAVDPRTGDVVVAGRDQGRLELIGAGR